MRAAMISVLVVVPTLAAVASAQESAAAALQIPAIRDFVGHGFGDRAQDAPAELEQLGRLAGLWIGEQELRRQDGSWAPSPSAIWAWKYVLGGHAVQDLWYQSADALPVYLQQVGRDYLLTGLRMYDVAAGRWRMAWMANGGGQSPGADFGTLHATMEQGGRIVVEAPAEEGGPLQRIVFSDITDEAFVWTSSFSQDGGNTWMDVMRVHARRLR